MEEITVGLGALALLVGFPLLLLGMLALLGALEHWMLEADERATQVERLLEGQREAGDVEVAVTRMLTQLAGRHDADDAHDADEAPPGPEGGDAGDTAAPGRRPPLNGHRSGD